MTRRIFSAIAVATFVGLGAAAQSAADAYSLTPTQLRGSARFVSMGGAFTSLGSDLSCMKQNPAGLGLYRYSDLGLSFDISIRNFKSQSNAAQYSDNKTPVIFDNFGYAGVFNLSNSGILRSIQWGFSYNRLSSFERRGTAYVNPTNSSLSNYVASFTNGTNSDLLLGSDNQSPYNNGTDWLSILAYNSLMISNSSPGTNTEYVGLYQNGTHGDALYEVNQRGYVDEYNIDIAGNLDDVVYWGLGVGIYDVNFTQESNYSESMSGAYIYDRSTDAFATGNAGFNLYNLKTVTGSGANIKLGVIVRPVDQFRIGFAVHTPTWLHLTHRGYGYVDYNYTPDGSDKTDSDGTDTPDYDYRSRLNTPWRFMVGVSGTIAGQAIISADYERVDYANMKMKQESGLYGSFQDNTLANEDIRNYFKAANIFRIGAELRLTNSFSVRAGYNWQGSSVKDVANSPSTAVATSGTEPSYTFFEGTNNVSLGLGYRYKGWYIDLAWQYTRRKGTWHAYTNFNGIEAPTASLTDTHNNIVISTGLRF